ncbi:L-amino acid oxidase [Hypoxylon sp. FL0890]|nr:L-amino acid oxidase [Hypoxylon sp. FL0890]
MTLPLPLPGHPQWTHDELPQDPSYKDGKRRVGGDHTPPRKVCIVGAGIAGLYIAMILDSLEVPNLTYDILETNSRVGGRVYTHHFSKKLHDYYDIGAMRYPNIPIMKRTFDLFNLTEMSLIPYYLSDPKTLDLFNDHFSARFSKRLSAFSESVIDSFDFDYPGLPSDWYCIDGGTTLLSDAMHKRLKTKVQTEKRVESISIDRESSEDGNMSVKCADETNPRSGYSTVFATPALGCLARMDLRTLELHPSQKDAIRSLHYDDSVKVALQFDYPWWIVDCGITAGGVASTDLPLRTCVYPSYNLDDGSDKPAVLLATYTWAQDANRMGSLVNTTNEDELAYSWSHDPATAGAFALFGPGQFRNLYPYLTRPAADSKFHIVGEVASAHHAWIVGALDSAYTALYRFLRRFELWDTIEALEENWG